MLDYWKKVDDRNAIEWAPNVVKVDARIDQDSLIIELISDTPNFKECQMKEIDSGIWEKVVSPLGVKLKTESEATY